MTEAPQQVPAVSELPDRLELSVPADDTALELTHELVSQLWERHPSVPDEVRTRFETGVVEILANVIEHAFAADQPGEAMAGPYRGDGRRVLITLGISTASVQARLSDNGVPARIDLSEVTMPDEESESGRGLAMALALLSELTFARGEGLNVWELRCDLP